MKKIILSLAAVAVMATSVFAQEKFFPGWQLGLQGGAGITVGETNQPFKYLLSPQAAVTVGYNFTPVFTLRGDIFGWNGKGVVPTNGKMIDYAFNYGALSADAVFDICNIFAKEYKQRVVNPYIFAGVGGMARFNNKADKAVLPTPNNYWDGTKFDYVLRGGVGIDFRVSDGFAINLEVLDNLTSDKFNSKVGDYFDQQINALLGVKFYLGQKAKKAAYAEELAAAAALKAAEEARLAKEKADAEAAAKAAEEARLAAEKAAAEKAAAEKAAAEKAAAEKAAAEAAAAAKAQAVADAIAAGKSDANNVYFAIGKSVITENQMAKVNKIVKNLKKNPDASVVICGFADKSTGNPDGNMTLSENRANVVADAIVAAGIAPERVVKYWFGDTEQISKTAWRNRVSVCVSK